MKLPLSFLLMTCSIGSSVPALGQVRTNPPAIAQPLIDQAAMQWEKVVTTARQKGVANEWTRLAQERLHDFIDQARFPVLRQELIEGTERP